jgi:uncharacterized protein (TIGR02118 family)
MVKGIALFKRKPGLSLEQFRNHYEQVHAPLARSLFPSIRGYVRNYVTAAPFSPGGEEPEFDCITEQWFDSMEGFQSMANIFNGEAGRVIREDEKRFLDRNRTVYLIVEEVASR